MKIITDKVVMITQVSTFFFFFFLAGSLFATGACKRVEFLEPVTWSFSADWKLNSESSLIFVDFVGSVVSQYDENGKKSPLTGKIQKAVPGIFRAGAIATLEREGVYLLEDRNLSGSRRFVFLSESFEFLGESPIPQRNDADGNVLLTLYYWHVLEDERSIVAYADIQRKDDSYTSAIVKFSLETSDFEIVEVIPPDNPVRQLYLLRYPLLDGEKRQVSYVLSDEKSGKLKVLTKQSDNRKSIEKQTTLATVATALPARLDSLDGIDRTFRALNQDGFIASIINWHSRVFILTLSLTDNPLLPRRWLIKEIDSTNGQALQTFVLPTSAPHLMVIPGDDYWAIVEKGLVFKFNLQLIESTWYIPSELLDVSPSRLEGRREVELCLDKR